MNFLIKIVFRNILRNRRRSLMTGSAIAAGAMALLLFGGYTRYIFASLETNTVQRSGHLAVYKSGYYEFGAGNPAAYGIAGYQDLMQLIGGDPVLKPMLNVLTPTQSLLGIAGNFSGQDDASKTFMGVGLIPSDRDRMRLWDEHHTDTPHTADPRMSDGDESRGLIGFGMARLLGLCGALALKDCPPQPVDASKPDDSKTPVDADLVGLAQRDSDARSHASMPEIQLLAATAQGAPNVMGMSVAGVERQGVRELDENLIYMNLGLAQQLVYGRGSHEVTAVVLQLHRTEDLPAARARLRQLFKDHKLDLEVRDFGELNPFYGQVVQMFGGIFLFISMVMGMIVLFAVVNTMTMNVMERTNEIGTIRAMGVRRSGIRLQFTLEGFLIGAIGAAVGAVLAVIIAALVNGAALTWIPPGNANPVPLRIDILGHPGLLVSAWVGLVLVATVAALMPANRGARLSVVDALRHV
jgi:putative ABC transport system permease protein